jgi:hypothetical protein
MDNVMPVACPLCFVYIHPLPVREAFLKPGIRQLVNIRVAVISLAVTICGCEARYDNSVDYAEFRGSGTMSVVARSAKMVSTWQSTPTTPDGHSGLVGGPSQPGKFYLRGMQSYVDTTDPFGISYRYEEVQIYGGVDQVRGRGEWSNLEGFYMPDAFNQSQPDQVFRTNQTYLRLDVFDQSTGRISGKFWFTASRHNSLIDTVNVTGTFELSTSW